MTSFSFLCSFRTLRLTVPFLALALLGGCSYLDSLHDKSAPQKAGFTTPRYLATHPAPEMPQVDSPLLRAAPATPVTHMPLTVDGGVDTTVDPSAITKVALLVPLSGKSANLGQAMVNAAQLAVFDMGVNGFELMPRDTKGTAAGSIQAAHEAVADGAALIVGPLFAAEVAATKPVVKESHVPMLSLSTDISLAEPDAYVMGFAPTPQVERVVSFAAKQGLHKFAALIPSGPYGQLVSKAFEESVKEAGGIIVASENQASIAKLIEKKTEIEALFLPFGGAELRKIAGQLSAAGFEAGKVRLIGTGLWDEPNVAEGQPLLIGGWYAASDAAPRQKFNAVYKETYNQDAPRLVTLAYDATALAAVLTRTTKSFDAATLTAPAGFAGLDGLFRLTPGGQIQRGLAVNELTSNGSKLIDPSPSTFAGI